MVVRSLGMFIWIGICFFFIVFVWSMVVCVMIFLLIVLLCKEFRLMCRIYCEFLLMIELLRVVESGVSDISGRLSVRSEWVICFIK